MRQGSGLAGNDGCLDRDLLRVRALLANVADGKHLIANPQVADTLPHD